MKMTILEITYKNIRKISDLKLSFTHEDGTIVENSFIMMANGTGKTTTMGLVKGLFDGTATSWSVTDVKSYAPKMTGVDKGEFSVTVKFDEKQYKYFLELDYQTGKASIETAALPKGREIGLRLPESLKGIFTKEFVRRFVFDGEQAAKSMDSSSNEAEETIKYLYRLDELDEIVALNQRMLAEIQTAEGNKGSASSISNLRTRQSNVDKTIKKLTARAEELRKKIKLSEDEKREKDALRSEIDRKFDELNKEKTEILHDIDQTKSEIDSVIANIMNLSKSPYLLSRDICDRMLNLGNSMTKLKLPKASSKDFFFELAHSKTCVCGREIGKNEQTAILENAERYLGSDQQAVLNAIKSSLTTSMYDERLKDAFERLSGLREQLNRLNSRKLSNQEKLTSAGGEEAEQLQNRITELIEEISISRSQLEMIVSKDESNDELTEDNNLHKAHLAHQYYEQQIAKATRTNAALRRKDVVEDLIKKIKEEATSALKTEIIRKTNEKLRRVITDDYIEIENIDRYIKLKGRNGASEGQTLSIAYCFLGTLFEDSELQFPFIIDSPTGKMDFDKRQAVADIIPVVFNQMIAFVQSAEVERFADRFYENDDSQFTTIIASPDGKAVEVHNGIEFFDSYQREHKGDDK